MNLKPFQVIVYSALEFNVGLSLFLLVKSSTKMFTALN